MTGIVLRPPRATELDALSRLLLRSKAHWGYDRDFMEACVAELTVRQDDITESNLIVADHGGMLAGMAQVGARGKDADLQRLFVDPPFMALGLGRQLFTWCVSAAREISETRLLIEADPAAAPFYQKMGANFIGEVPSGSIAGRNLPLLAYSLR